MSLPPSVDPEKPVDDSLSAQFGRSLRAARLAAGLTQLDVAKAFGDEHFQNVSRLERGRLKNLTVMTMERLARAVNCSLRIEMHHGDKPSVVVLIPRAEPSDR